MPNNDPREPAGWTVSDYLKGRSPCGRTKLYEEINAGRLQIRRLGKSSIITAEAERDWLNSLPTKEVHDERAA